MKKIVIAESLKTLILNGDSLFRRSDIQVFTAATNDQILELHRRENVNLIITRLDIPGMNSEELYTLIRNDRVLRQVSLIMLCEETEREKAERCKPNAVFAPAPDMKSLIEKAQRLLNISGRESYRVLLSVKIESNGKDRSFFCKSENLSASGLLLETDHVLAKGDRVVCSFFLPESRRIILTGEVVRDIQQTGQASGHRYGIKFFQVSSGDKAAIEDFVGKKAQMFHS